MVATLPSLQRTPIEPHRHRASQSEVRNIRAIPPQYLAKPSGGDHQHIERWHSLAQIEEPFASARARLDVLSALQSGWDTYDAQPISRNAVAQAYTFLTELEARLGDEVSSMTPYFVAPLPYGGVQLEWRKPGREIEIEFAPDGTLAYLLIEGEGTARVFTERENVSLDDAVRLVTQM